MIDLAASLMLALKDRPAEAALQASAEQCKRSFAQFVVEAWPIIEPNTPLNFSWYVEAVSVHLQAVTEGKIKRLIINVPPRSGKSNLVSVLWPCWEWTRNPASRWLFASYSLDLSTRHSLMRRRLLESDWYTARWPGVVLSGDQNAKREFENASTGYMIATSVGGTGTGRGGDRIICDDPHNVNEGESEVVRESTLEWFDRTWSTRKNNPSSAAEVVIMQRVHFKDVTGHALEGGDDWALLKIPMEYEGEANETPIGWRDPRSTQGQLLDTTRFPADVISSYKLRMGSYAYAGQYQQRPAPAEGGAIKKQWLRYWEPSRECVAGMACPDGLVIDPFSCPRFMTVDLAASLKQEADYTALSVWCAYMDPKRPRLFMLDLTHARMEGPDITPAIQALMAKWKVGTVWVEKVGFQLALVQEARRRGVPVRELERDRDKLSRVLAATPLMEAGGLWLPARADWTSKLETEALQFPKGEHDDIVDTLADACNLILGTYRGSSLISAPASPPVHKVREEFSEMLPVEVARQPGTAFRKPASVAPLPDPRGVRRFYD